MSKPTTTIDTITDEQIEALQREAAAAGDAEMARTAERAYVMQDADARARCVEAICAAEAMAD